MKKIAVVAGLAAGLFIAAASAAATTLTTAKYDFTAPTGVAGKNGSLTFSAVNDLKAPTVTVTAWSLGTGGFESARLQSWSAGLGICSAGDDASKNGCNSPEHTADSEGTDDYFLFKFSQGITLRGVSLTPYVQGADADFVWGVGNLTSDLLTGRTVSSILSEIKLQGEHKIDDISKISAVSQSVDGGSTAYSHLLLGASKLGSSSDRDESFFKLVSLTIGFAAPTTGTVPVPGTLALLGLSAIGLGVSIRRRKV